MAPTSVPPAFRLDLTDRRTVKALEIAATANQWLKVRTADGAKLYGIPAQSAPGRYYLANARGCDCPDFLRRMQPCKHSMAVAIRCAQAKATRPAKAAKPAKADHSTSSADRYDVHPATALDEATQAKAARYVAIFGGAD